MTAFSELGGCAGGLLRPSRDCRPSGLAALKLSFANCGTSDPELTVAVLGSSP